MYGPIVLLLTVDFLLLLYSRRYLAAGPWQFVATLKTLLPVSLNALLKQVSYFLMSSGAIVAVLHWASTTNIAAFGSLMALLMLGGSGFSALYQPLLAAMANAHSHSDKRWFRRAYFGGLAVVLGVTGVLCLIALASGPQLATLWLNADLGISRTLCVAMAVYFLFWMLSEYHFLVLASMAKLTGLGKIYVFEGISALSLGSILAHFDGIEGMAIGLAIGTAIFSLFYLPLRAWRIVAREGWSA
jgi:O-antigen/teichoic acid export membrane protein